MTHYPEYGPAGMDFAQAPELAPDLVSSLPGTPEQLIEERVARLLDDMINLAALAFDPEQKALLAREARGIAQILLHAQLMLSIFDGKDVEAIRRLIRALDDCNKPSGLRLIRNAS